MTASSGLLISCEMLAAKRPAALLLAAALLLLGAACGGGSKSSAGTTSEATTTEAAATTTAAAATALPKAAYVTRMKTIGRSLSTSLNSLGAATTAPKAAAALTAVQTDLRKAADRIESITPPQQIKTQHAQLAKAVRDFADELDPDCEYVVQQEWTEYTGFLEEGCDAALFVGMHAMAGTPDGVMNHTVSGQSWLNLAFNGTPG